MIQLYSNVIKHGKYHTVGTIRGCWYIMSEHAEAVGILCRNTQERLIYYIGTHRSDCWYIMASHPGPVGILCRTTQYRFAFYYQDVEILFQLISNRR